MEDFEQLQKEDQETINKMDFLVSEYALTDDDKLTESAKLLKKWITSKVFEWETKLYMKYE